MSRQAPERFRAGEQEAAGSGGPPDVEGQYADDDEFDVQVLVERAQRNDEIAFAALYVIFFRRIHRYLAMRLGNAEDAQEVAHDVFERLLAVLPNYDSARGRFAHWIFSIARNLATDHLRKTSRLTAVPLEPAIEEQVADRAAAVVASVEAGASFQSIIDGLPREQQRILTLRYVYDLSPADIADVVGAKPAAVRQAQCRALRALSSGLGRPPLGQ